MVSFRHVVAGTAIQNWWDDGSNAIAFSRGSEGFVAINNEDSTLTASIATSLAPGAYCDLLTGGLAGSVCAGTELTVDAAGMVPVSLAPRSAVAVDVATRR